MTEAAMDPLQALLAAGANTNLFPPNSRYQGLPTATMLSTDGRTIVYVRRRFVPQPDGFVLLQEHVVTQGERLDVLAAQFVGDPEQFWRLCDSNRVLRPAALTESIGRRLRITLPEGVPGATPNA